jgi:DNA-binding NtrC family response regulator
VTVQDSATPPMVRAPRVLIASGHERDRGRLEARLLRQGYEVLSVPYRLSLGRSVATFSPDVAVVAESPDDPSDGLEAAMAVRRRHPRVGLVLVVWRSSEERAIAALRARVDDYLRQPVSPGEVAGSVARLLAERARTGPLGPPAPGDPRRAGPSLMVGDSAVMRSIKEYIVQVAATDSNVLISGETGTGKELVARLIHHDSRRSRRAFVPINCAAIPEALLESELFGHERGAFTGAHTGRAGALTAASGGTVFFDEIGDMSLPCQAKILRAIENREVHRLGSRADVPLDVRVIAATNQDLERSVAERTFRSDLYFRLNVARIHLPPLRERKEDLPQLLQFHVAELNQRFGRAVEGFTDDVSPLLSRYDWPGNVRELRNVLEAAFVTVRSRRIGYADLPERFRSALRPPAGARPDERARLLSALLATNWNKSRAAKHLQWSRMTVYRKIAKYCLVRSTRRGPVRDDATGTVTSGSGEIAS